jgi:hypothetical protein
MRLVCPVRCAADSPGLLAGTPSTRASQWRLVSPGASSISGQRGPQPEGEKTTKLRLLINLNLVFFSVLKIVRPRKSRVDNKGLRMHIGDIEEDALAFCSLVCKILVHFKHFFENFRHFLRRTEFFYPV